MESTYNDSDLFLNNINRQNVVDRVSLTKSFILESELVVFLYLLVLLWVVLQLRKIIFYEVKLNLVFEQSFVVEAHKGNPRLFFEEVDKKDLVIINLNGLTSISQNM